MFYENPDASFKILGVFCVERNQRDVTETNRFLSAISYRISGSSIFYTDGQQLEAGTGAVTYIPTGCGYRHWNDRPEKIIILHLADMGIPDQTLQVVPDVPELEPLFRNLLETWETGDSSSVNRCMSLLYNIFEALQQKNDAQIASVPKSIMPGMSLLRENFRNPRLSVSDLAKACFVSEVYFRRVYRAHVGKSPLQTILDLRFQYAQRLLISGYYTCKQSAELSGFTDVKYFRTAFKKRIGETPVAFMKRSLKNSAHATDK